MNARDNTAAASASALPGALASAWLRAALQPRRLLGRLGLPGVIAIGLCTAAAAFYVAAVRPLEAKIADVEQTLRTLAERVERVAPGLPQGRLPVAQQLSEFYRIFPQQSQLTDIVGRIFELAKMQGITLQRGEYRVAEERAGKLRRFEIRLPVKAEYPQIRRFLASLAAEVPTAVLEHLQFDRQKIGDPVVEATIKLALYVDQGS